MAQQPPAPSNQGPGIEPFDLTRSSRMLYRWGTFTARRRWILLIAPLMLAMGCIPMAAQVTEHLSTGGWLPTDSEAAFVDRTLSQDFGRRTTSHYILFRDPDGLLSATDPDFRREVERLVRPLRTDPAVTSLYTWGTTGNERIDQRLISDDRTMSIAAVGLNQNIIGASTDIDRLTVMLESDLLDAQIGGWPATTAALQQLTASDLARAEYISAPLMLILLVVVFGGLLAAGLPILIAAASLIPTFAVIAMMSRVIETSIFAVNVVTMIGIAVGVDYALILISRYREEAQSHSPERALAVTMATAGRAIIISGIAVAIGLAGLIAFGVPAAMSTGLAGAAVVLLSVVLSLTMLPALLAILGDRATRPTRSIGSRWAIPFAPARNLARQFQRTLTAHPMLVLIASCGLLLGLAAPLLEMDASSPTMAILPSSEDARQMYNTVDSSFSSTTLSPITVIVEPRRGRMTSSRNLDDLQAFTDKLDTMENVASVTSVWNFIPDVPGMGIISGGLLIEPALREAVAPYLNDQLAVVEIGVHGDLRDVASERIVSELRENGPALTQGAFRLHVGGDTATNRDLIDHVGNRAPLAIGLMIVATWLILFAQFRSVLLPIKAILLNMLSLSASFGALVWIFQQGHLHRLLRFEPTGYTVIVVPILMFCFMFGLSMDYEVLMLSRIREAWKHTGDNLTAIRTGLHASAGVVTSAALIMLVVFSAFGTSDLQIIKAVGIGLALAVLVDATLIRLIVLPAAMQLMGRWNWWAPSLKGPFLPTRITVLVNPRAIDDKEAP